MGEQRIEVLEIQEYARAVGQFVEQAFPRTYALFAEGRK